MSSARTVKPGEPRCVKCSDPIAEVGTGLATDGMCQRCAFCIYCERSATHWQESTDNAHCDDCHADIARAKRVEIDDYVRNHAYPVNT